MTANLMRAAVAVRGQADFVAPPQDTARLQVASWESPASWISYDEHAAYADFVVSSTFTRRVAALAIFIRYLIVVFVKRLVAYESIPAHLRRPRSASAAVELLRCVLGNMFRSRCRPESSATFESESMVLQNLNRYGCSVMVVPPGQLEAIAQASGGSFTELRSARGSKDKGREFMESRTQALRKSSPGLFEAIADCFQECGIFSAASAYLGHEVRLVDVSPQINDRSDDFWRHVYPDVGGAIPRTAYLHKDASGGEIKVMIYMSDVGPASGPFSFVLNSHSSEKSRHWDWIEETNDHAGLSGTDRKARSRFASLPRYLRRKCAFGNDILDDSPASRKLTESEWKITGRRGTVVVFDPKGFHRGGMVEEGERLVITCTIG